jgi:hypothetical protein
MLILVSFSFFLSFFLISKLSKLHDLHNMVYSGNTMQSLQAAASETSSKQASNICLT